MTRVDLICLQDWSWRCISCVNGLLIEFILLFFDLSQDSPPVRTRMPSCTPQMPVINALLVLRDILFLVGLCRWYLYYAGAWTVGSWRCTFCMDRTPMYLGVLLDLCQPPCALLDVWLSMALKFLSSTPHWKRWTALRSFASTHDFAILEYTYPTSIARW